MQKEETQMKKRIIITALSVMLASSSIIPAYAALPANASTEVSLEDMFSMNRALKAWADLYTEELKQIVSPKDRYRRMCELVVTNWDSATEQVGGQDAIDSYMRGVIGADQFANIIKRMCDNTGIEGIVGGCLVNGCPNTTAYVRIDGTVYTQNWAALELWGMDDRYVFIDHNFNGIEIGNPFAPREQEVEVAKSTFYKFTDMVNYVYMHDTDGTLYSVDPAVMSDTLRGEAKFYKCVAGKLIAITEEEAVSLGYVEE